MLADPDYFFIKLRRKKKVNDTYLYNNGIKNIFCLFFFSFYFFSDLIIFKYTRFHKNINYFGDK